MSQKSLFALFASLACALACGGGSTPGAAPSMSGGSGGGASGGGGGTSAGGSSVATSGGGSGGSGAMTGGSTSGGGSAGAAAGTASGGTGGSGGAGGGTGDGFPSADCAPGAVFCDGFEGYPLHDPIFDADGNVYDLIASGDTEPTWLAYHFHGPPRVDGSKPFEGMQEFHLDTEAGDLRYADIIRESPDGVELFPPLHYGRVMLWLKAMPQASRWNIVHESGLLPGSQSEVAQFSIGGQNGKLAITYSQYGRIVKNAVGAKDRRGGGPQNGDPPPQVQCVVNAATQALPTMKWTCVEWMLDRSKSELHVWVDGAAQSALDVTGGGGTCSIGSAASFQAPEVMTELVLGWEAYEKDAPGQEAWFDDFAIGRERLGCPTP